MRISGAWFLLAMAMPAAAHDEWTDADTVREVINVSLFAYDAYQTHMILQQNTQCTPKPGEACRHFSEANPLLGPHPSGGRLAAGAILGSAAHAGIAYALPRGWREAWQYVWIGAEIVVINRNRSIGIKVTF